MRRCKYGKQKRIDSKGRTLKSGESQRKDGRYQYRYTDRFGKRQCVYSLKHCRMI
ncbi:integrase DNA-binding domain-containing protein [Lachnotalea glycerini]|uniref:integrase DNA-binding domain-containing protein n=1 Tax=Lachnotalea glycerini TaxID=1763509 RepID=UPI002FE6449A